MTERRQFTLYRLPFGQLDRPWHWLLAAEPFSSRAEAETERTRQRQHGGCIADHFKIEDEPEGWGA